jgi:hypothetical protein
MDLNLYDCPHCNTSGVLLTDDGLCPNCKKAIDLAEDRSVNTAIVAKETPNGEDFIKCKKHPEIQAEDRCTDCGDNFCVDCLIEIEDEKFCDSCNSILIQEGATFPCKQASSALIFAIIGLIFIGIILEPIAISKALKAKKIISTNPRLTGSNKATAAIIIAIIYLLLFIFFIIALNLRFI